MKIGEKMFAFSLVLIIRELILIDGSFFPTNLPAQLKTGRRRASSTIILYDNIEFENIEPESLVPPTVLPKLERQKISNDAKNQPVLVIGATGKIGRRIVKQLLLQGISVRALVRNYEKAIEIFEEHDDEDKDDENSFNYAKITSGKNAPKLNLIVHEFISSQQEKEEDINDVLYQSLKGCSTIISCVGTVRKSNIFQDFFPPWRMFQMNVTNWCQDSNHPYFVHYVFTKRIIDAIHRHRNEFNDEKARQQLQDKNDADKIPKSNHYSKYPQPKQRSTSDSEFETNLKPYKIIRISDLNIAFRPFGLVSVLVNLFQSMIFRYQYLSEQLIRKSNIHYGILRPGDFINEERDEDCTYLQLDPSGYLPSPSIVGYSDVAAVAVASSIQSPTDDRNYTLAIRWCNENMYPQSQGKREDGFKDAITCFKMLQKGVIPPKRVRNASLEKNINYGFYTALAFYSFLSVIVKTFLTLFGKRILDFSFIFFSWVKNFFLH